MISLKRNSKGQLVPAPGLRSRSSSVYTPNQTDPFKISRSKFNDFLTCKRCFYLDRVKGLASPSTPGWTLNETTDLLLKKEFDLCREMQISTRKNNFIQVGTWKINLEQQTATSINGITFKLTEATVISACQEPCLRVNIAKSNPSEVRFIMTTNRLSIIPLLFFVFLFVSPTTVHAEGYIQGDCVNCYGTKVYIDGGKYVGEWRDRKGQKVNRQKDE